jgi:hypothetical protein
MSALLNFTPTLKYIGSVDITSALFGSTMYLVSYSNTLVNSGNVLMFEYKLVQENILIPSPETITLGFVSIENAAHTGINNQWNISLPASDDVYDANIATKISVRIYIGLSDSSEIGVTEWSEQLEVHNPPSEPAIFKSFYDTPSVDNDDLFIFLHADSKIDYGVIRFVAAFYYQDLSGNQTKWDVSEPISATLVNTPGTYNGKYMVHVPEFGKVSTLPQQNVVYVAVYAVYEFFNALGDRYFSVSHVSNTFKALQASENAAPTVTGIDYSVYNSPHNTQDMTINWIAPDNSGIPTFYVDYYRLYKSVDNINWTLVDGNIPDNQYSHIVDVSSYQCGTTMNFKVEAVSTYGTVSPSSPYTDNSHLNIFKYATAPQNLVITNTVYDPVSNLVTMDINFDTPVDNGCGTPTQFVIVVQGTSGDPVINNVTYDGRSNVPYVYNFSSSNVTKYGSVEVYLLTTDTNPSVPGGSIFLDKNGASISTPYIANHFVLDPVNYQVYVEPVGSQDMNLSWNQQADGPWLLAENGYKVLYQVNSVTEGEWVDYQTTEILTNVFNATAEDVDDCGSTINFYAEATLVNGGVTYVAKSNIESINVFKYASAPQNLIIRNTAYNPVSNLVTMDINFNTPVDNGCGVPTRFVIVVQGTSGDPVINNVTYDGRNNVPYVYNFSSSNVTQYGSVKVYLLTTDTNPEVPGSSIFLDRNGASSLTPYIAINYILNPVDYQVYVNGSQDMNLSWNDQVNGPWLLAENGYKVLYQVNSVTEGEWIDYQTTEIVTNVFNATAQGVAICGDTINFYAEATLVNGGVTYVAKSNIESINVFKYATAPRNLIITDTVYNPDTNLVTMDINFNTPENNGCGTPTQFAVVVQGTNGAPVVNYVTYDGRFSYTYRFSSFAVTKYGNVEVYLLTTDTNPDVPGGSILLDRNGASNLTPYIANHFVLDPVNYQVYVEPVGSQDMNLSWNQQADGPWLLAENGYKVLYQVNSVTEGQWIDYQTTEILTNVFNATAQGVAICGDTINFYAEATLVNGGVTYVAKSNIKSINVFKYASAPQNLIISNTAYDPNTGLRSMDINFDTPLNNGCGAPTRFVIVVQGTSGSPVINYVTYTGSSTYTYSFSSNAITQSGIVEVYLLTTDTNPDVPGGSIYLNRNGASSSTPYITIYFVLDPVDYQVYVEPVGSQNMNLSWNSQIDGDWSLDNYKVFYRVSSVVPNSWIEFNTTINTLITFNAATQNVDNCGDTINFYVQASLVNNGVTYLANSNTKSINIFKYASATEALQVLWSSSDADNTYMDIRTTFNNPLTNGCGSVVNFIVNVEDNSGNQLDSKIISYVDGQTTPYVVNFNNVMYASNGYIVVRMITIDTNGAGNLNGEKAVAPFISDNLPIYKNVSMSSSRDVLTFNVISQTSLVPIGGVVTASSGVLVPSHWSTIQNNGSVNIVQTFLENNEYQYSVTMYPSLLGLSAFPVPFGVAVSNSYGIQHQNVNSI